MIQGVLSDNRGTHMHTSKLALIRYATKLNIVSLKTKYIQHTLWP